MSPTALTASLDALRGRLGRHLLPLLVIFFLLNLPLLGTYNLSIDDEISAFRTDPSIWIAQGRWTTYLFERFWLTQPSVMFLPVAIFGLGLVFAFVLIVDMPAERRGSGAYYLLFALFAGFPFWFFLLEFYANLPSIGLGAALCGFSVWCFSRLVGAPPQTSWKRTGLAVASASIALAVAMGAYQSFLFLAASALVGTMLLHYLDHPPRPRQLLSAVASSVVILVLATAIYYAVWRSMLSLTATELHYIDAFLRLDLLLSSLGKVLEDVTGEIVKIYGGSAEVYGRPARLFAVVILGALAALVYAGRRRGLAMSALYIALFVALVLSPFGLNLGSGGFMPYRSLIAIPYVFLVCGIVLTKLARPGFLVSALVLFAVLQSAYSTSLFSTSSALALDHDRALAARIYDEVVRADPGFDPSRQHKVLISGTLPFETGYPRIPTSTVGQSFFEWEGGNNYRIVAFMRLLGYTQIIPVPGNEVASHAVDLMTMPVWPAEGSVRLVGDATLVRLSLEPSPLLQPALLERLQREPFLASADRVLFRLDPRAPLAPGSVQLATASVRDGALELQAQPDPQLTFALPPEAAASCRTMQITLEQTLEKADVPRAFFLRRGATAFGADNEGAAQAAGNGRTSFFLHSGNGFGPTIRIDPGDLPQKYLIHSLSVGCVAN